MQPVPATESIMSALQRDPHQQPRVLLLVGARCPPCGVQQLRRGVLVGKLRQQVMHQALKH